MRLDARRPLAELRAEWQQCTRCELGQRRELVQGKFVGGEGHERGIMFIGEGPEASDEQTGHPFSSDEGESILRRVIKKLHIEPISYFTNIVACRSCVHETSASGEPLFYQSRGIKHPRYKDQAATAPQVLACKPRLCEEIYIVDPLIIITLGAAAASALLGRPVSMIKEVGTDQEISIPGVTQRAVFTEKRGVWGRTQKGELHMPSARNEVKYLVVPTFSPGTLRSKFADMSTSGPVKQFVKHLKTVVQTYEKLAEYYGIPIHHQISQDADDTEIA